MNVNASRSSNEKEIIEAIIQEITSDNRCKKIEPLAWPCYCLNDDTGIIIRYRENPSNYSISEQDQHYADNYKKSFLCLLNTNTGDIYTLDKGAILAGKLDLKNNFPDALFK